MSKSKSRRRISIRAFTCLVCVMFFCLFTKYNVAEAATSTGKVTATSLNVRSKASTSASIVAGLKQGTEVTIKSTTTDSGGTKWYYISAQVNGKAITGYVSAAYISITNTSSTSTSSNNTSTSTFLKRYGYVKATSLNVRSSPSTSASIVTRLPNSKYVLVIDKVMKSGATWYRISAQVNGKTVRGYALDSYIILYQTTTQKTTYDLATVTGSTLTAYKTANPYDKKRATLKLNQQVICLGSLSVKGIDWSYVYAIVDGKGMSAYVKADYLKRITAVIGNKESTIAHTTQAVSMKKIAVSMASNVAKPDADSTVTIRGKLTVLGKSWYKCDYVKSDITYTGYIVSMYVKVPDDAEFFKELSGFPSSYHHALKVLHEKYPRWHFSAVETGLDWNTVIENESNIGRNVMQSNQPKGGQASAYSAPFSYLSTLPGAYDWSKDEYKIFDGTNWYCANSKVIAHYMDPRNALTDEGIWQFESLAYDSRQKKGVVESILSNTFMKATYSVKDKITGKVVSDEYKDTFMEAGKINGASPYFLAVRAKQELGANGSGSVSGTYPGYVGYYNYYNIGANDSSTGQAIVNGLRYASSGTTYRRPWTNPYKAIVGGAEYIASAYIKRGQNTLYTQKFNVVSSPYYSHQYMTNVQAPASESKSTHNSYYKMGISSDAFVFYIPVYKNMPSSPCSLPAKEGNPNSYVKNITIKNGSTKLALTPTFHYLTKNYTMVVNNSVSAVKVSATPISSYATIVSGTGTVELAAGKTTTVSIVCKAGDGTKTTYTVKISRKAS